MSFSFHTFNILIITIAKIITSHIISSLYHHRILSIPTSCSIHLKNHHRYHQNIMTTTKLSWLLPWVVYQHRSLVKCRATKLTVHDPCRLILGNVFYLLIVIFHCFQHMSCCHHGYGFKQSQSTFSFNLTNVLEIHLFPLCSSVLEPNFDLH